MPNYDKHKKKKSTSELHDLEVLAQFREKKKIQNDALKKIINGLSSEEKSTLNK